MAVTLKDVAARAGVSPVVVSHVLNNRAPSVRVSEATAERVRVAASELGYRLNVFARNFREQQTAMIGVLHGLGFARPVFGSGARYFGQLMDGIIDGAFAQGYSVTLCPKLLGESPEDAMTDGRFDGLIWYSTAPSIASREMISRCRVPIAIIHARSAEFDNKYPTVVCDNDQGICLAVDHLVSLRHRRIAYALDGDLLGSEAIVRLAAYRRHMSSHGFTTSDKDILGSYDGCAELEALLHSGLKHTAIIAHNDSLAGHIVNVATASGLTLPRDLSVVGFDSTSYCLELRPSLTSVSQPLAEIGRRAIESLVTLIGGTPPDPIEVVLPCGLDVRDSTAPPKTLD